MNINTTLQSLKDRLKNTPRMPVVFLGHGSPMNAIEDTEFSRSWSELGRALPRPQAILIVSAHWMTRGSTLVDVSKHPRTIHDFGGFPQALFEVEYPAKGHPDMAREVVSLLSSHHAKEDERWGLDHGSWSLLCHLYPDADVPVFQLSIDMRLELEEHMRIGRELASLRDKGVLILGSGNIVHNLREIDWGNGKPRDWALEFDDYFAAQLAKRDFGSLAKPDQLGAAWRKSHPSIDHYIPSLSIMGAASQDDELAFLTDKIEYGTVSMRSFIFYNQN